MSKLTFLWMFTVEFFQIVFISLCGLGMMWLGQFVVEVHHWSVPFPFFSATLIVLSGAIIVLACFFRLHSWLDMLLRL